MNKISHFFGSLPISRKITLLLIFFAALSSAGSGVYVYFCSSKVEPLELVGVSIALGLVLSIFFGSIAEKILSKSIFKFVLAVEEVSRGNLETEIQNHLPFSDETGDLAEALNTMIRNLRENQNDLKEHCHQLILEVDRLTLELKSLNQMTQAILRHSSQGFLIFGPDGIARPHCSKSCEELLEIQPPGKSIWEILQISDIEAKDWYALFFSEEQPFRKTAEQGPKTYRHSLNKRIELEYHLLHEDSPTLGIMLICTDKTAEHEAKQIAEREKAYAKRVLRLIKSKDHFLTYIQEARQIFLELEREIEKSKQQPLDLEALFRSMHRLKGGAASLSLSRITELAQNSEFSLLQLQADKTPDLKGFLPRLNGDVAALKEAFYDFLQENKEVLGSAIRGGDRTVEVPLKKLLHFSKQLPLESDLEKEFLKSILDEPIQKFFLHCDELVTQIAAEQDKDINPILFKGGILPILAQPYFSLFSSLVHAFRNAAEHGIEFPEERMAAEKPAHGTITVYFAQQKVEGTLFLKIVLQDDGRGIDPERVRTSHFGIGMETLFSASKSLGGRTEVHSKIGKGTLITVTVPYFTRAA